VSFRESQKQLENTLVLFFNRQSLFNLALLIQQMKKPKEDAKKAKWSLRKTSQKSVTLVR